MTPPRTGRVLSLGDKIGSAIAQPDRQSAGMRDMEVADDEFVAAFHKQFRGLDTLNNAEKVRAATLLRNTLHRGAERQIEAVIDMGQALLRTESIFSEDEWKRLMDGGERLLGISKTRASMYKAIAQLVVSGRVPREACPESYTTVYQISLLADEQLSIAKRDGLLRRDVARREIMDFRQRITVVEVQAEEPVQMTSAIKTSLRKEQSKLIRRQHELREELEEVATRLAVLKEKLA